MKALPSEADWQAMADRLRSTVPYQLLTILEVDWNLGVVRRAQSSDAATYPSGGEKRLIDSAWGRHVLEGGEVFRAPGAAEIQAAFADHELLLSLGLQQALNIPVAVGGRVAWTLNLLRKEPPFSDEEVLVVKTALDLN